MDIWEDPKTTTTELSRGLDGKWIAMALCRPMCEGVYEAMVILNDGSDPLNFDLWITPAPSNPWDIQAALMQQLSELRKAKDNGKQSTSDHPNSDRHTRTEAVML